MNKSSLLIILVCLFSSFGLRAEEVNNPLDVNKDDRILILAPHPDDESIGTAGVIQKALKTGAEVKVVLFTNGDNNELAFIVYEKRLTIRKGEFLHMGEVRRKETISAMAYLGVKPQDVIFLGYPDFGTMEILTKYWQTDKPYRSMFPRQTKVPYPEAISPNAPYVGESVLEDLKKVIAGFKPTKIFVSHPADTNRDHRALYVFTRIALWDLKEQIQQPKVFSYIIHVLGWPMPRGYHLDLELNPPAEINDGEIAWQKLGLINEEINSKHDAIEFYKSQIECDPHYLFTFARKNELFGDYPMFTIKRQVDSEIYWQDLGIDDEVTSATLEKARNQLSYVAYALKDEYFFIKIVLKRNIDRDFGVAIFLLGYNKSTPFAKMPKIQLSVGWGGLVIKDKKQILHVKNAKLSAQGKELIFKIPLNMLGNPDYLLSSVKTHSGSLPLDASAWRVLLLEQ
ncbi:MAG: PIG-L family deacetylase [Candidatus Omnitrophica bacterium]|nr:PIG-L family deacetylase [Candidatus Omnitrophota bacterium]